MRVLPVSRGRRTALLVVLAAAAVSAPLWWSKLVFVVKLVVPGPAYEAAADRNSGPARIGEAMPLSLPVAVRPLTAPGRPTIALQAITDLASASAVADPPGPGPVLVATLDGLVHELDLVTGDHEVVLDVTDEISTGGERGLLGLAVDPAGERLYLDYTDGGGDTDVRSWALDADHRPVGAGDEGVLHLEIGQPFENHNGGNLVFGPDGALWIATGDGGGVGDRGGVAQDPDHLLGKVLRVVPDPDGGVLAPADNPDWGGRPEVWAIGLRNPWRYSFDRATGELWIGDVGQQSVEEVSVLQPGIDDRPNLGWSEVEGNNDYKGEPRPEYTAPVITYGHDDAGGCSVAGGYVYRGEDVDSLAGWYLFADYCGGWVRAVPSDDPTREPVELLSDLGPVVAFAELDDGELLVLGVGGISRIVPGGTPD
jgi:glucose/arabinose dehydrogenase